MVLVIQSVLCEGGCNAETEDTEHFLLCKSIFCCRVEYLPNKSDGLNQDIIRFVITFVKKPGRFDKLLIIFSQ